jgi:pyridoxamine 5'-phosphate oxidase
MDLESLNLKIKKVKYEAKEGELNEIDAASDPLEQFVGWFEEALQHESSDPTAMVLSTIDTAHCPDSRVVLLKEVTPQGFIFFTNYRSNKAQQLDMHQVAAINFHWPNFTRQIRIKGRVQKIERQKSDEYFATRARGMQLAAQSSPQSAVIANREELDARVQAMEAKFQDQPVPCPEHWGGYILIPTEYEFFQSRKWRMHDRLAYRLGDKGWERVRLAP